MSGPGIRGKPACLRPAGVEVSLREMRAPEYDFAKLTHARLLSLRVHDEQLDVRDPPPQRDLDLVPNALLAYDCRPPARPRGQSVAHGPLRLCGSVERDQAGA